MFRIAIVLAVLAAACGSKKSSSPDPGSGTTTTETGSGSGSAAADTGSGSGSGSGSDTDVGSGSAAADAGSGSAADSFDFDKLTHDEQADFMKKHVMPAMKVAFQKFDGKKFAKFSCKTCHGKDPQKAKYKMPNPELPKLDFAALEAGKQEPKIAEWMGKVVTPDMAGILHLPVHSKTNPDGFGCLHCHEQKK